MSSLYALLATWWSGSPGIDGNEARGSFTAHTRAQTRACGRELGAVRLCQYDAVTER